MVRVTLEEAVFEAYAEIGDSLLDDLDLRNRDIVQRAFGIFPYQSHSISQLAKVYKWPRSTTYNRYRTALKILRVLRQNFKKT